MSFIKLLVSPSTIIRDIKEMCEKEIGILWEDQRIFENDLANRNSEFKDFFTVQDCNLKPGSSVNMKIVSCSIADLEYDQYGLPKFSEDTILKKDAQKLYYQFFQAKCLAGRKHGFKLPTTFKD